MPGGNDPRRVAMGKLAVELLARGWAPTRVGEEGIDRLIHDVATLHSNATLVLSERELQVMDSAARGDTVAETARRLGLSFETVKSHHKRIKLKLGAKTLPHAVAILVDRGDIIDIEEG